MTLSPENIIPSCNFSVRMVSLSGIIGPAKGVNVHPHAWVGPFLLIQGNFSGISSGKCQPYWGCGGPLNIKILSRIFLGHQGPTCQDVPEPGPGMSRTKTLCKAPFSVILDGEWPGCPAIWVVGCTPKGAHGNTAF